MYLRKSAYLIVFFLFITARAVTYLAAGPTPLRDVYKSGKIELIPDLIITLDSFPEDVNIQFLNSISLWKGHLYISDSFGCSIKMLSDTGKYIKSIGSKGKGPSDLYLPSAMMCWGDRLTVWETGNRRFSVFDTDGNFINTFSPPYRGSVYSLKSLDDGRIVVERELSGLVKGKFQQLFGLELFTRDFKRIKDLYTCPISNRVYSKDLKEYFLRPFPVGISWAVLPGNKIVIGDGGSYRLEIHDMNKGKIKTFTHSFTPGKVTAADKEAFFANIISMKPNGRLGKGADTHTRKNTEFPKYKPAFKKIITDCDGNILVFNYGKTENGETMNFSKEFDAFDSNGNFINHVAIISKEPITLGNLYSANRGVFWTKSEYYDNESAIVKYRVKYNKTPRQEDTKSVSCARVP